MGIQEAEKRDLKKNTIQKNNINHIPKLKTPKSSGNWS
jgi:hypothetical protein